MAILSTCFLAIALLIHISLTTSSSPSQIPDPHQLISNPTENIFILNDDHVDDELMDPAAQSVYFETFRRALQTRDRLCSICLATLSFQDLMPFDYRVVVKEILRRELAFIRKIEEYIVEQSEIDEETSLTEDSSPENTNEPEKQVEQSEIDKETLSTKDSTPEDTNNRICNYLVPKEVKRLSRRLLTQAQVDRKKKKRKKYIKTVDLRLKAHERLVTTLENTPGDLSCDADYSREVAQLKDIFKYRLF